MQEVSRDLPVAPEYERNCTSVRRRCCCCSSSSSFSCVCQSPRKLDHSRRRRPQLRRRPPPTPLPPPCPFSCPRSRRGSNTPTATIGASISPENSSTTKRCCPQRNRPPPVRPPAPRTLTKGGERVCDIWFSPFSPIENALCELTSSSSCDVCAAPSVPTRTRRGPSPRRRIRRRPWSPSRAS